MSKEYTVLIQVHNLLLKVEATSTEEAIQEALKQTNIGDFDVQYISIA